MAFSPVSLPIQEILLTNFITDIATISNANDLLLQDKLQDLINTLEIDINALSIGTDNPISYVRAQSFIIQDTGLTFQTGSPLQIIAKLEKNSSNESVLTVNNLNVDYIAGINSLEVNDLTIDTSLTLATGTSATFNGSLAFTGQSIESKETVVANLVMNGTDAEARITLTNTSKKNIFLKLNTSSAPDLNPVYNGSGPGTFNVALFPVYIDFDATNPPAQNSTFNIYLVDIIENQLGSSILTDVNNENIDVVFRGGFNLNVSSSTPVYLHSNLGAGTYDVGINRTSPTAASDTLVSNVVQSYGHSLSLMYILDENTNDRLMINGMVGLEFFIP